MEWIKPILDEHFLEQGRKASNQKELRTQRTHQTAAGTNKPIKTATVTRPIRDASPMGGEYQQPLHHPEGMAVFCRAQDHSCCDSFAPFFYVSRKQRIYPLIGISGIIRRNGIGSPIDKNQRSMVEVNVSF
jgi:hypothetical protein